MTKEIVIRSGLLLLAIALNALEFFIPRIPLFPWLKPGIANIVTLLWIIRYGFVETILFALLRTWIVSFYFGFSFLTFSLGMSGALCASCAMYVCWRFLGRYALMGTVGIGIIGALFHNAGQLCAVYVMMARNLRLFYQVPVMVAASVLFGGIVGLLVPSLIKIVSDDTLQNRIPTARLEITIKPVSRSHAAVCTLLLFFCLALVFIDSVRLLLFGAVFITGLIQVSVRGSVKAFFYPLQRFWLLFIFIGVLHLFFTYGARYESLPFITREGLLSAVKQWLRLWAWLQTTVLFLRYSFHTAVLYALEKVFSAHRITLYCGLIAVEKFPAVIAMVQKRSRALLKILITKPSRLVNDIFTAIVDSLASETDARQ